MTTFPVLNSKNLPHLLQQLLLVFIFSGLLSIAFLDHDKYYLPWIAFIPLLFAVEKATFRRTYLLGLTAGFSSFMGGTYWIVDFVTISKGYSTTSSFLFACLYWFYCAHLTAFLLIVFKWLKDNTPVHEFLLFPLTVAVFTSAYPMLFSMRLGETQINFHSALQAVEFVGVHGLDVIIALFNVVIFRFFYSLFSNQPENIRKNKWPSGFALFVVITWLIYGMLSYSSWQQEVSTWSTLKVGIVQPNEIPRIGKRTLYPGYSYAYPPEMDMTHRLSSIGAEIIIWPEAQHKAYLDNPNVSSAYQETIKTIGVPLLFQDMEQIRNPISGALSTQYNTAIMLDENGQQIGAYQKIKRIPFGEYVPLVTENSYAKSWVEGIFGEFLNELSKGEKHQLFTHKNINIIPLICYETTFPSFVGKAVKETAHLGNKLNGTLLVGLSNDGWFGSTHQPYQHIMASVLRAVENRLPLVHVANNGPSITVSPSGRVIFKTDFQKSGGYIAHVPYSHQTQGSFYSRHPNLFDNLLYAILTLIVLYAFGVKHSQRKAPTDQLPPHP